MQRYAFIFVLALLIVAAGCSDIGEPLQPECEISGSPLDFGQISTGQTADGAVTIRNSGSVEVAGEISISGAGFTLASPGGSFVLEPLAQITVTVTFAPGAAGDYSGVLSTGVTCGEVGITGTASDGTPGALCDVRPGSIDFGNVEVGSSMERSFKIHNVGTVPFSGSVGALCSDFRVASGAGPYTLVAGDSLNVTVRFTPTAVGTAECTVSTGTDCAPVICTGTGEHGAAIVSYASDIQPIFNATCAISRCHVAPSPTGGLDLRAGVSYANLVGVTSVTYAPALRIVPGDPGASVLYNKATNTGMFGGAMPPGTNGLRAAQADLIRSWILDGAPNN